MSKRNKIALISLIMVVLAAVIGVLLWHDQQYNLIIMMLVVISWIPFYFKYELSHPKTREVVILAIMIALTTLARTLFILFPSFKPVSALIIIMAVVFGKQDGFLCGSLSALISDFIFGIGPWTPFQMLAWGLIGYLAGLFCRQLYQNKWLLYGYGAMSGIIFSMIMDLWSVLAIDNSFNLSRYLFTVIAALPVTITYIVSNIIFIFVFKDAMFKILQRVKVKYGITEGN